MSTPDRSDLPSPAELIVVMPIYNEEANIRSVLDEWHATFSALKISAQFYAINDGSRDGTLKALQAWEAEHPGHIQIFDKPNSGHGRSCRYGYDRACASGVPWVLQIDSDGQCDPGYFSEFWSARSEADCVFGVRRKRDDGRMRKAISTVCRWLTTFVAGVSVTDPNVPYRLMRTEVLAKALNGVPQDFDIHNIALTVVLRRTTGLRWRTVPIRFRDRQGGTNSINIPKIVKMGVGMLKALRRI